MRCHRTTTRRPYRSAALRRTAVLAAVAAFVLSVVSVIGPAAARSLPYGAVEKVHQRGKGFEIVGWAADPDSTGPATVYVRVDGSRVARIIADLPRPDIAKTHPGIGTDLGFDQIIETPVGTHKVCATVLDQSTKKVVELKCVTITLNHDPMGALTGITQSPGNLTATGWGIDADTPKQPRRVFIRLDGTRVATTIADAPVPGLDATHPKAGDNHGFSLTFPVTEGTHQVCLKVQNSEQGFDKLVQCEDFTANFSPTGAITRVAQVPGGVSVTGYASDPDRTATPTTVSVTADGATIGTALADGTNATAPGHGFAVTAMFPAGALPPGARTICVVAKNLGKYGKNTTIGCRRRTFDWNPSSAVETAKQQTPGVLVTGWATDPDTTGPVKVAVTGDGKALATVTAGGATGSHPGHMFSAVVPLTDGKHTVCAYALNARYGSANAAPSCRTLTLSFDPYGALESVARASGSTSVVATGWAIDPDTRKPIDVTVTVNGRTPTTGTANISRPDVAAAHPGTGTSHGYAVTVPASDTEHRICVSATNVAGGSLATVPLGCSIINAVHPVAPAAPTGVSAIGGYGGARIVWTAPTSDGGAPWTGYTIKALPSGPSITVGPRILATTLLGLKPDTQYSFSVVATNVAGPSAAGTSPTVRTQKEPPAQTTPAPISTSRYIRNVYGASSYDLRTLKREGAADATANPSGHGYLSVLAIGGQDESRKGVILSAGIRFVSYADMVADLKAYVDGYASKQNPSAPVTIAIATNNDIDVYRASGVSFADNVIDPVRNYAKRYPGITIAGSDDMEPGFRAGYAATKSWLQGYLAATTAPFVFTGSADGCAYSYTNGSCNNGWTMRGLYYLTGGAAPIRMVNLPQVYNTTMAQQWRYISLTGVDAGQPKINFGGALTEWTACQQARSCGSLTAVTAWKTMWAQLRAEPALRPSSLPYSTDLRIDS